MVLPRLVELASSSSGGLEVLSLFNLKLKTLRENIAESKLSYEIMDDAGDKRLSKKNSFQNGDWLNFSRSFFISAQTFLKAKIQDNITKYFMLIVFSAYIG